MPFSRARDAGAQPALGPVAHDGVADGLGHNKTDARRKIRTRIGPVGMHDDQSPACSAGAGPAHCRGEIGPLTQTVTCRQHAGLDGSGRELGAALAAAGGQDGAAGAGAHAQAEAVRLGAATVVRLEGALAHEILLRLGARISVWLPGGAGGGRCDRNRQTRGSPRASACRSRGQGYAKEVQTALGQRYGSAGGKVKPEEAGRQKENTRSSDVSARMQAHTPGV